jgi:hypothetical protein
MHAPDDEQEQALRVAAALATYADPVENPSPRLLAARAIEEARVDRSRRWKWWTVAGLVSAVACLLVFALVAGLRHAPARLAIAVSPHANPPRQPQLAQIAPTPAFTHAAAHHATRAKPPELPRLDQFPTPQPLTDEEKLMLVFVSTATPATQQLVARAVEPPLPILAAESTSSSSLANTSLEKSGAPHEQPR